MKQKIVFFVVFLFATGLNAQVFDKVDVVQGESSRKNIIRMVRPDVALLYTEGGPSGHRFMMVRSGTMTMLTINIPSSIYVLDLEVRHDTAYFCGYTFDTVGQVGMVGMFDIYSVLSNTSAINYQTLDMVGTDIFRITQAERLALYDSAGQVYMCMTGTFGSVNGSGGYVYMASTMITARFDDSAVPAMWNAWAFYNKEQILTFTDVATADHSVMVTAVGTDNYMYLYPCRQMVPFFMHPMALSYGFLGNIVKRYRRVHDAQVLVTAAVDDQYVVASLAEDSAQLETFTVNAWPSFSASGSYSTHPSVTSSYVTDLWRLRDLRRHQQNGSAFLLADITPGDTMGFDTWGCRINYVDAKPLEMWNVLPGKQWSFDVPMDPYHVVMSGNSLSNELIVGGAPLGGCSLRVHVGSSKKEGFCYPQNRDINSSYGRDINNPISYTIGHEDRETICQ